MTDQLNEALKRPATAYTKNEDGTHTTNHGHINLDHAPCYGGYCLNTMSDHGGVFNEFEPTRLSAGEMFHVLRGVLDAIRIIENQKTTA